MCGVWSVGSVHHHLYLCTYLNIYRQKNTLFLLTPIIIRIQRKVSRRHKHPNANHGKHCITPCLVSCLHWGAVESLQRRHRQRQRYFNLSECLSSPTPLDKMLYKLMPIFNDISIFADNRCEMAECCRL